MPELPEVESTAKTLHKLIAGKVFQEVILKRTKIRYFLQPDFVERLVGNSIIFVKRRAKYLVAQLDNQDQLIIHLGMSGRLRVFEVGDNIPSHNHVHISFKSDLNIYTYFDPRRFGMLWVKSPIKVEEFFANYGKDPFEITKNEWCALFKSNRAVKLLLLDQNKVSGIGNIYACEALWRAKIHPSRAATEITKTQCLDLLMHMRSVLAEAIAAGGSTLRDYRDPSDQIGQFQYTFAVYDRQFLPCPAPMCNGHVHRIIQSGRSTFFCPVCQV